VIFDNLECILSLSIGDNIMWYLIGFAAVSIGLVAWYIWDGIVEYKHEMRRRGHGKDRRYKRK